MANINDNFNVIRSIYHRCDIPLFTTMASIALVEFRLLPIDVRCFLWQWSPETRQHFLSLIQIDSNICKLWRKVEILKCIEIRSHSKFWCAQLIWNDYFRNCCCCCNTRHCVACVFILRKIAVSGDLLTWSDFLTTFGLRRVISNVHCWKLKCNTFMLVDVCLHG